MIGRHNEEWMVLASDDAFWLSEKGHWEATLDPDLVRFNGNFPSESSARAALAAAQPWPGYQPPAPSKPESVDAAYVAANAGEYRNDEGETFRSDGRGSVTVTLCDGRQKQWVGVRLHQAEPATRFRPLPPATPASKPNHIAEVGKMVTAPSPVEGEPELQDRYDSLYAENMKALASLAAARAEVESLKVQVLNLEDAESLFESTRASNAKLKVDLAALKGRVERADALAENVQRCQRAEGPCPVCKAAAADYLAVVPTGEKGAGK